MADISRSEIISRTMVNTERPGIFSRERSMAEVIILTDW